MNNTLKNVLANYGSQAWIGIISLIFVPLYVSYIGVESYGLVGVFAVLQSSLSLLDMGLTPMITREMARFKGGAHTPQSICDLLRTVEIVCLGLAVLICVGVFLSAQLLAIHWLRPDKLAPSVVAQALSVMGAVVALRFCENLYRGVLYGLQEQVWFSAANAVLTTVRHVGALALVAWVMPTVQAFFAWQVAVSALCVLVFGGAPIRQCPSQIGQAPSRSKHCRVSSFSRGTRWSTRSWQFC